MKIIDEIFEMNTMVDIESKFSQIFQRFIRQLNNRLQQSIKREIYVGLDRKLSILRKLSVIEDLKESIVPIISNLDNKVDDLLNEKITNLISGHVGLLED